MKSFKEYNGTETTEQEVYTAEELTKKLAAAYNGKSNGEMLQNILEEAERSKRAGTLSNTEIDAFFAAFSPMLDRSQRKKLQVVIDRLKEI